MKFSKDDLKSLAINLISNFIFQFVLGIIPSLSLTALLNYLINKIFGLNTLYICIFIFAVIEILIIFFLRLLVNKKSITLDINNKEIVEDKESKDQFEDDNKYEKLDYYFEKYHKHLTVYKNGNGIMINSFTLIINDINSIIPFKRELNIEDAKKEVVFPSLKEMKQTDLKYRFDRFCFRCKCINNKDLIQSVEEKYWTDDSDNDDLIARDNPKDLKWILRMNPSCVEIGKPYNIVYVISIPGMFPIKDGYFDEDIANKSGTHGSFNSRFTAKHQIKEFIYTVSFENQLTLHQKPNGKINSMIDGGKNLHFENENNIIYDKYIFKATDLEIGGTININWIFKEKTTKRRTTNERKR